MACVLCTYLTSEFIYFSCPYFSFAQIPSFTPTVREIILSCPIYIVALTKSVRHGGDIHISKDAEVLAFCKDDRRMVGLLAKAWTRAGDRWIGRR